MGPGLHAVVCGDTPAHVLARVCALFGDFDSARDGGVLPVRQVLEGACDGGAGEGGDRARRGRAGVDVLLGDCREGVFSSVGVFVCGTVSDDAVAGEGLLVG